jgi:hypothetical protein
MWFPYLQGRLKVEWEESVTDMEKGGLGPGL